MTGTGKKSGGKAVFAAAKILSICGWSGKIGLFNTRGTGKKSGGKGVFAQQKY